MTTLPEPPPPLPEWQPSRGIQLLEVEWVIRGLTERFAAEIPAGKISAARAEERLAVWAAIRETVSHG
jgi:hypothetical protein